LWGDTDPSQPEFLRGLMTFVQQPIADRLFIDALLADRPVERSFHDGLAAQRVMGATIQSHVDGRWVDVPLL
jgi:predicted dehydrogenase